ncbi:MAG: hypothetical protein D8M59_11105 [Planctomycetes bacterium]|nr:hypothetical protein [Planctomycetota bacterium]NOG54100.1 hypothetical protein [Planctomycetota bacterium]
MPSQSKNRISSCLTPMRLISAAALPLWGVSLSGTALADVVLEPDALPGVVRTVDFSSFDNQLIETNGPLDIGEGVLWEAGLEGWIGDMAFGLRNNGYWDWDQVGYVALNTSQSHMLMTFEHPVSAAGGFVNYAPLEGFGPMPTIEAVGTSGEVLERFTMDVQTPGKRNAGQFMGFVREEADIYQLRYIARFGVLDDLRFSEELVPAPGAGALLGFCGLTLMARRATRRRQSQS